MGELHVDSSKRNQRPHPEDKLQKKVKNREKSTKRNQKMGQQENMWLGKPQEAFLPAMEISLYLLPCTSAFALRLCLPEQLQSFQSSQNHIDIYNIY